METIKNRNNIVIKPVGIEHIDQFNGLLSYVFQVTERHLEESGYEDGELILSKRPILQNADVIGWFNNDQLVSQLCIYPCRVNIHGKIFSMGGLTGVGTYPEYSNMGLMSELIKEGMKIMRKNRQWLSYLFPYSIPYYRRKGWEIINDKLSFTIKDTQIPEQENVEGFVERLSVLDKVVKDVYSRFCRAKHGAMIRGKQEWEEYWRWENEEERTAGVYYDKNNKAMGYIIYWIVNDVFHIKEMIYLNSNARTALWNFIHAHTSMVDKVVGKIYTNDPIHFMIDDGHIQETIEPYFMARIIDVRHFLTNYPFQIEENFEAFHFIVSDPVAYWNNGVFSVRKNNKNKIQITKDPVGKPVKIDIQTLTTMLMSYRRPFYLHNIGRLKTDNETIKTLNKIIPEEQPYFSDYF